jgi:hypothetical protein
MSVRRTWNERDGHRMIGPVGGRGVRQEQDMHASLRVLDRQQLAVWNSRRPRTTIAMASVWGGRTGSESRRQCRHSVGEHFRLKASIFAACPNSKERCCDIGRPCDHLGTCSHFQGDNQRISRKAPLPSVSTSVKPSLAIIEPPAILCR